MKWPAALISTAACLLTGCANVRLVKRDDCWVRQTESFPKRIKEEIGPCQRAEPKWSEDRVARLVQECMAEADHRFHNEALAAWSRGQPQPVQPPEQATQRVCMNEAATVLAAENETLKTRLAQLAQERDALQGVTLEDREHMRSSQDRMTDALGEAAKKPAPSAYSSSNSASTTESQQTAQPGGPVTVIPPAAACASPSKKGTAECAPPPKVAPSLESR